MSCKPNKYLLFSTVLVCAFSIFPATAQPNDQQLLPGTYHSIYERSMPLCQQTVSQQDNDLVIDYEQPCTLSETRLQCNSTGDCIGTEDGQNIYVQIFHNNIYRWEDITEDFGGSFLLNDDK